MIWFGKWKWLTLMFLIIKFMNAMILPQKKSPIFPIFRQAKMTKVMQTYNGKPKFR